MAEEILSEIKQYLIDRGIRQSWLAKKIYRSPQTVTGWFSGRRDVSVDGLASMADALGFELHVELIPKKERDTIGKHSNHNRSV